MPFSLHRARIRRATEPLRSPPLRVNDPRRGNYQPMIGILIAILLAALVYFLCVALGLPAIVGIVAAILVLISGIGTGGYGLRLGGRDRI